MVFFSFSLFFFWYLAETFARCRCSGVMRRRRRMDGIYGAVLDSVGEATGFVDVVVAQRAVMMVTRSDAKPGPSRNESK
jgi:hypothetical protein